eukprot:TRINITY_DN9534_c0_g1_i1.p2 TRINITY_DN9534_c0_g1~~TRINITY_DN9534_c0_g1_i1.p2  ORF type:complete len:148 (-),score=38.45 TRINITY_DN9534_c0_g1_i1:123-527(-)
MPKKFACGATIQLKSKASGKFLRIKDDGSVDGNGGHGPFAKFVVVRDGVPHGFKLRNVKNPHHYLRVTQDKKLDGKGGGGKWCEFKKERVEKGVFRIIPVHNSCCKVGILPDGCPKAPHDVGDGPHGRFEAHFA